MGYRDPVVALQERLDALVRTRDQLRDEAKTLEAQLQADRSAAAHLSARLQEAGEGGGRRGVRRDRIDVAAWVLCALGVVSILLHLDWHRYIGRDATVIPAILWLATPGLLAFLVAWPYRRDSLLCRCAVVFSIFIMLLPFINLMVGLR